MSTSGHRDPADDTDPTGVRALLAALPDPGPMPDTVAARIGASLRAVQETAAGSPTEPADQDVEPGAGQRLGVTDLSGHRVRHLSRGRHRHVLAAAAAVASVAVVGGVVAGQLGGDGGGPWGTVAAIYDGMDTGGSESGAEAPVGDDADSVLSGDDAVDLLSEEQGSAAEGGTTGRDSGGDSGEEGGANGEDPAVELLGAPGTVTSLEDLSDLTTDTFAVGVDSALDQDPASTDPSPDADGTWTACIEATGAQVEEGSWSVGRGTLDGSPVVVVVRDETAPTGAQEVPATSWAVSTGCLDDPSGAGAAREVLLGPVELP